MGKTSIEWAQNADGSQGETWNPTRGCALESPGCAHCYAMRQAHRFSGPGKPFHGLTRLRQKGGPVWSGEGFLALDMLDVPLRRRAPTTWFVNSMSDLFWEKFTDEEIAAVFGVMAATPRHTYQILTKRAKRMREWFSWVEQQNNTPDFTAQQAAWKILGDAFPLHPIKGTIKSYPWPLPNVWLGVSVEDQKRADERIPELLKTPAAVRFLSVEPLLEAVDLHLDRQQFHPAKHLEFHTPGEKIDWCIVGGESGPGSRPMHPDWARSLRDQCVAAGVRFFFKQWGQHLHDSQVEHTACSIDGRGIERGEDHWFTLGKKSAGRLLDGREWNEMPEARR